MAIRGLAASLIAVNELGKDVWPLLSFNPPILSPYYQFAPVINSPRKPNKVSQKKRRLNARRLGKFC